MEVVELKETSQLVGNVAAISVNRNHHNCEIGYCFCSRYWNNGFATEALKAVITFMKTECDMHIIEAKHYSSNPSSGRVMEKVGMIMEATLRDRRYNEVSKQYCDLICYYI